MTKKTRLIILLVCVACFFVVSPVLVLYSIGDRFDFKKMEITETGGIYVRTFPTAEQIIIDSKIFEKPGMFSNSIFVQSLLPDNHTVLIKKAGYYDYSKTLPVQEEQVTKLENVLLFKKNMQFEIITDTTQSPFNKPEKFTIKNSNLYYSDSPENADLTATQKTTPVLKGLVAFVTSGNNITWLGTDGFLYKFDINGKKSEKFSQYPLKIVKNNKSKIIVYSNDIFVNNNGNLVKLTYATGNFYTLANQVSDAVVSPDGKYILYSNKEEIFLTSLFDQKERGISLYKSGGQITNLQWLNNDYIIFTAQDKIIISEIDYRGNINSITLPQTITVASATKIDIKNPAIFFNHQDGKLYILTGNTLLSSEKII